MTESVSGMGADTGKEELHYERNISTFKSWRVVNSINQVTGEGDPLLEREAIARTNACTSLYE